MASIINQAIDKTMDYVTYCSIQNDIQDLSNVSTGIELQVISRFEYLLNEMDETWKGTGATLFREKMNTLQSELTATKNAISTLASDMSSIARRQYESQK